MRIIRGINSIIDNLKNPVVTLGNFDGVHRGHQAIFHTVVKRAREIGGTSVAFTFEPHPLKVLAPHRSLRLLNTFHAKMELIASCGIDVVICAAFTRTFADQHPDDFARDILHEKMGTREIYVGYDYAFGKNREGGIQSLIKMGQRYGFGVTIMEAVHVDGLVVSSTRIRELIESGKMEEAANLLGRYYAIEGAVVHGSHRGRKLGYPTANLQTPNELLPPEGVYAVFAEIEGKTYSGAAALGIRPTFEAGPMVLEISLFDFSGDLYGKLMKVSFVHYLRSEKKFTDEAALISQIRMDIDHVKEILGQASLLFRTC
ncbi:MAG: bifunctional riboflavin kinase/FAD synthetase [Nitrospirota bacterium]